MNKKLQEILNKINAKKEEIYNLVNEEKMKEARAAKEELIGLQDKFDLLSDLDDDHAVVIDNAKPIGTDLEPGNKKVAKNRLTKAIVNIVKAGFTGTAVDEKDMEIYNKALTSTVLPKGEHGEVGIGITIPEDIRTEIDELRRSDDNLEQYVNVETVSTKSGTRNIELDAESTPFDNVEEAAAFPELDGPQFIPIEYKVTKKGGILKMTAELLEDTAENVMAYIKKWLAKKVKATRNAFIIKKLDEITSKKEVAVANIDSLKDIFNVTLDPAISATSIVITNQQGFNYMDKLKDVDGNYILQKDPTGKTKGKLLFGEHRVVVMSKRVLKSEKVMNRDGHTVDGYKHPVFCGDLKEAITLFDRKVLSLDLNNKGAGLWENDITGLKVRDRFDVQAIDKDAVVKGQITEMVAG